MGVVRFSVDVDFEGGVGGAGFSVDTSRDGARTESTGKERPETKRPGRERVTSTASERSIVHTGANAIRDSAETRIGAKRSA